MTCWQVRSEEGDRGTIEGVDDALQLSTGLSNSCVVRHDGTVACWGMNWTAPSGRPVPTKHGAEAIPGIVDAVQVSAGRSHACAVRASGEVDCWGLDSSGQVGDPPGAWSANEVTKPSRIDGIDDAVEVSCGAEHTCVRRRDGTVSCVGVLGDVRDAPHGLRAIDGLRDVAALASGDRFVCGLTRAGEVWCAGANSLAELGGGDHDPHAEPVRVRGLAQVAQITASGTHACARTGAGAVWCWGSEFGHGIMAARTDDEDKGPVRITGLANAIDVAVGEGQACAIVEGGAVWCWGPAPAKQPGQAVPEPLAID